jgi:hypothetical protein
VAKNNPAPAPANSGTPAATGTPAPAETPKGNEPAANAINIDAIKAKVIADAHPAANIFPMMMGDEFGNLCLSLKQNGFDPSKPIKRDATTKKITDGRNREAASQVVNAELALWNGANPNDQKAFVSPVYVEEATTNDAELLSTIMQDNFARRHLSPSQKAAVVVKAGILSTAYASKNALGALGEKVKGDVAEMIAAQHGVNHDYIYKVKTIAKTAKIGKGLLEQIAAGELSVMAAYAKVRELTDGTPAEGAGDTPSNPDAVNDGLKKPVPAEFVEIFKVRSKFATAAKLLRDLRGIAKEIAGVDGGNLLADGNNLKEVTQGISAVAKALRNCEPHVVCPHCGGDGKHPEKEGHVCPVCGGVTFLTEPQFDSFTKNGVMEATEAAPATTAPAATSETTPAAPATVPTAPAATGGKKGKGKKSAAPAATSEAAPVTTAPAVTSEGEPAPV